MLLINMVLTSIAVSLDNGLGLVPPMGYSTWNDVRSAVTEQEFLSRCEALVDTGLSKLGYLYCNIDDGWPSKSRNSSTHRIEAGAAFPSGMKSLADHVHSLGLRLGLYTDRGYSTCGGFPGSLGYEALDAATYAEWGVDYIKEDNCKGPHGPNNHADQLQEFRAMRDGLNATGRPIYFDVCGGGGEAPWNNISYFAEPPFGATLANSWRVGPDSIEWQTARHNLALDSTLAQFAGVGGWNNPDMLLGSTKAASMKMKPQQSRSQFSLWAVLAAPLIISAPVGKLSAWDMATYSNAEVIAVSQDRLGKQGRALVYKQPLGSEVIIARDLDDGGVAMVFLNANFVESANVTCDAKCWSQTTFPAGTMLDVRDLWNHSEAALPRAVSGKPYSVPLYAGGYSATFKFTRH